MTTYDYGTRAVDVVGVFDENFKQMVPTARPMRALVNVASKLMEHPLESGATITDHRVKEPVLIDLDLLLTSEEYQSTYKSLREIYNKGTLLIVQTKSDTYANMMIEAMPHDEVTDIVDGLPLVLKLKEVIVVTTQFQALPPKSVPPGTGKQGQRNTSTVKRGQQTGRTEPTNQNGQKESSILYDVLYGG